jgi:hypothetical protein
MKHIFPVGLITIGILLSLGAFTQLYLNSRIGVDVTTKFNLPDQLAGLPLTETKSGDQAISEFTDLHGKEFPVTSGAVGVYGDLEITLWIAETASDPIALELTNAMQVKIAEGNSPFIPMDVIKDRNRNVYALEGMGQRHYYFQSHNLVVWLAVNPSFADKALQQILEVYS